ncbi:MAG: Mut7-C RNAse domain-containing protein [Methanomassiliicoccales archaeon]|nr:Mut7-C RNAse domain-containing protein [Methanomassiliicoccales archaeon]
MNERPRFAADEMLGSLARWLRLMGYDTMYAKDIDDTKIIEIAKEEGRYLLTRDKELSQRIGERGLYVESDVLDEQLRQVSARFHLESDPDRARCTVCNGELKTITKEDAVGHVPEGALENNAIFYVCAGCGKYYWRGSHWKNISKRLQEVSTDQVRGGSNPR